MKRYQNFLFDLDGTIILHFWDKYRTHLNKWFENYVNLNYSNKVIAEKSSTIYSMLAKFIYENESKEKTKEEMSINFLAKELNLTVSEVIKMFEQCCEDCKNWKSEMFDVQIANGVVETIKYLKSKNCGVYLATNTYFPKELILNRLEWSGLDEKDFDFVADWSKMGYGKPFKEYFEYFLNNFNLSSQTTLMVGNSVFHDACSECVGIDFYLVENDVENVEYENERKISYKGTDQELFEFVKQLDL